MEKIVIIPTYNEKENIVRIIRAIFSLDQEFHILVIDDGSPDGTASIVKQLQQTYISQLFLEERKGKLGLGTAYIHGFRWAVSKGYEFIFEMDADFSHNPADLKRLYNACKHHHADVAVGSRYVKGGGQRKLALGQDPALQRCVDLYAAYNLDACKRLYRRLCMLQPKST